MSCSDANLAEIAQYERAVLQQPEVISNYWHLGLLYLLQGEVTAAQSTWFSGMIAIESVDPVADCGEAELIHLLQAEANRQLRQRPDLAELIGQQLLDLAVDPATVAILAEAVALQGRLDEAVQHWQQAIAADPNQPAWYRHLAAIWQKLEQYDLAIEAYQQAVQLAPDWHSFYQLGLCWGRLQQWSAAIEAYQQAVQLQPNQASLVTDLGWAWLGQQLQPALAQFRLSLMQQTNFVATYCDWTAASSSAELHQRFNAQLLSAIATDEATFRQAFIQLIQQRSQSHQSVAQATEPAAEPGVELSSELAAELQTKPQVKLQAKLQAELQAKPPESTGFYETTAAWAETKAAVYWPIDAPSTLALKPPSHLEDALHFSFRFEPEIELPGSFVTRIPEGRAWSAADQSSTAIFGSEQLLGDLSVEFPLLSPGHPDKRAQFHSALNRALPPAQYIPQTVAVLSGLTDHLYFHWMLDLLPRIDLLQRSGLDLAAIDYFWVDANLPFQQQTLLHLGIPTEKLLSVAQYPHLQAAELIVPSFPASPAWMPQWACEFLRRSFLPATGNQPGQRRLYLSRKTGTRRIINEAELLTVLNAFDFEIVQLEALSVLEQAAVLSEAAVVIGPHGGGLTNLVFCQPGTQVIELFSPHFVYPCYWLLSNVLDLNYAYLLATAPTGEFLTQLLYPNPRLADLWVDASQLTALLDQVL